MTDTEQLCERLRELLAKASPGPWRSCKGGSCDCGQTWSVPLDMPVARANTIWGDDLAHPYGEVPADETKANCALIAECRNAMPSLLDAVAQATRMREALEAIRDGNVPRPVAGRWRKDGVPCKHDNCEHNRFMWEDCPNCIDDHIGVALSEGVE